MSIFKGLGIGLIIGGLWQYFSMIPFIGGYLSQYQMIIMILVGVALYFIGSRH